MFIREIEVLIWSEKFCNFTAADTYNRIDKEIS
jgi:hypothetical protein